MAHYATQPSGAGYDHTQWGAPYSGYASYYQQPAYPAWQYGSEAGPTPQQYFPPVDSVPPAPPPPDEQPPGEGDEDASLAPPGQESQTGSQLEPQADSSHQVHSWDHAYAASAPQPQYQPSYTGQQASQGWNWGSQPTQHYPYPANTGYPGQAGAPHWSQQQQAAPAWQQSVPAAPAQPPHTGQYNGYTVSAPTGAPAGDHASAYQQHYAAASAPAGPAPGAWTASQPPAQPAVDGTSLQHQALYPALPSQAEQPNTASQIQPQIGFKVPGRPGVKVPLKKRPRFSSAEAGPAYTAVGPPAGAQPAPVRNITTPANTAPAPPTRPAVVSGAQPAAPQASGYPPSLRDFVHRAYRTCAGDDKRKERISNELRLIIGEADRLGERWTRRWDEYPLPPSAAATSAPEPPVGGSFIAQFARSTAPEDRSFARGHAPSYRDTSSSSDEDSEERLDIVPQRKPAPQTPKKASQKKAKQARNRQQRNSVTPKKAGKHVYYRSPSPSSSDSDDSDADKPSRKYPKLDPSGRNLQDLQARNDQRAQRFGDGTVSSGRSLTPKDRARRKAYVQAVEESEEADRIDWAQLNLRGTCTDLEKSYFRLHAVPHPSTVRPPEVLQKALGRLLAVIRAGGIKYIYVADQFKGMRQDLTVQRISDALAVRIYEAAARAALEHNDLPEYSQCQARLMALHRAGVRGCREEFLAYRILYQLAHSRSGGLAALTSTLRQVTDKAVRHPAVAHAMKVRQACGGGDAARLCRLYASAPLMAPALLDLIMRRARFRGLQTLTRAMSPSTVPVAFVCRILGFVGRCGGSGGELDAGGAAAQLHSAGEDVLPGCTTRWFTGKCAPQENMADALESCVTWLEACGAVIKPPPSGEGSALIDCKASRGCITMPDDPTAVAHGDTNLALEDFLKASSVAAN